MMDRIPYSEAIDAYSKWRDVTNTHTFALAGFFKFIGTDTFNRWGRQCILPPKVTERIKMINSPHGHALIKAHAIQQASVEVPEPKIYLSEEG